MKRFIVGILVFLSMTFATNRQNLLYKFLRSLIGLILTMGIKTVYFFRRTLDEVGNIRVRVSKKRHDREYMMTAIAELKTNTEIMSGVINSMAQDIANLRSTQTDLMIEIRRLKRDACSGNCNCQSAAEPVSDIDREDAEKYNRLLDALSTSTSNLDKNIKITKIS